jgi:Domain of unknown function (DUF1906)
MSSRPANATVDGVDLSQHIHNADCLASVTLPDGDAPLEFVVRYTSVNTTNNPQKQLTQPEVNAIRSAQLSLVLVHEEGSEAARGSYADGQADAAQALAVVAGFGMPPDTIVHMAIDFDAQGPEILNYARGFGDKMGNGRRAAYGGIKPLRYLLDRGLLDYAWQTFAWSLGEWEPRITAAQWRNSQSLCGNSLDFDSACARDYGQLPPTWTSSDRGDIMSAMDLTPAAVELIAAKPINARPAGEQTDAGVTIGWGIRQAYYRTGYLGNTWAPSVDAKLAALADQLDALTAAVAALPTAEQIAAAVVAALPPSAGGSGVTPAQLAAADRASADVLDPPTTP